MFEFIGRWLRRASGASASPVEQAQAKAWLDDLRRNELSMAARRRIAPNEPVRSPAIGNGAEAAVAATVALSAFGAAAHG